MTGKKKTDNFLRLTEENLELRRKFLGINTEVQNTILELKQWAQDNAEELVTEFYDFQFSFPSTKRFMEKYAHAHNMGVDQLVGALRNAQMQYFLEIFEGAETGWDYQYALSRVQIGLKHDVIDLPQKLYIGSYGLYGTLLKKYLKRSFSDKKALDYFTAINLVFNYDQQLVSDAYLFSFVRSMGVYSEEFTQLSDSERDVTEFITKVKEEIALIQGKAQAMVDHKLGEAVLDEESSCTLGIQFSHMVETLRSVLRNLGRLAKSLDHARSDLETQNASLDVSVGDVSDAAGKATQQTTLSVDRVKAANLEIENLLKRAREIRQSIAHVNSVAEQTKVLALNATIESARAGEAGRGFAVVAREVKDLAHESAQAAETIETQAVTMQKNVEMTTSQISDTVVAIDALKEINDHIADVAQKQARAVEHTSAVVHEIVAAIQDLKEAMSQFEFEPS